VTRQKGSDFGILVAVDDSPAGPSVIRTTLMFPWPARSRVRGVAATGMPWTVNSPGYVRLALARGLREAAARAQRALRERWPSTTIDVVDEAPVAAILAAAGALRARAIVVGWRGHGLLRRMFEGGSVSRGVVRAASCPVLVVKRGVPDVRRLVVGIDGSVDAGAAASFVATLEPPRGGSVTLVSVVEPRRLPSLGLLPSTARAHIARAARDDYEARIAAARRDLDRHAAIIARAGWKVDTVVRSGVPLAELVAAGRDADAIVVGARGAGGLEGLLLGSVADGVVRHARTSVLVVR
jgi:nucleotide-binding universal stress UspA family protein